MLPTVIITKFMHTGPHENLILSAERFPFDMKIIGESCNFKTIDIDAVPLQDGIHLLLSPLPLLVKCYNTTLANVLDEFGPQTKRNVRHPHALGITAYAN